MLYDESECGEDEGKIRSPHETGVDPQRKRKRKPLARVGRGEAEEEADA